MYESDIDKDEIDTMKEYKSCFGNYYDKNDNVCEEGESGLCNYCVECRRYCLYY